MSTKRYFLKIPPVGPTEFVSIPEPKAGSWPLSALYPLIGNGCDIVERVKINLPGKPYMWLDENGFANNQPPNMLASRLYGHGRIVGTALVEVGTFDLDNPKDLQRWSEKLAKWPREVNGLRFVPYEVE